MTNHKLTISQGKRPIWRTVIAAVFFTMMFVQIWGTLILLFNYEVTEEILKSVAKSLGPIIYWFGLGLSAGLLKTIAIDTEKENLITTYSIGPFSRDFISTIPELQYVSVFKDAKELYQVNLWYKGNKRYNMFTFDEPQPAFVFAKTVCAKLNLDLLDATERGNNKWVEEITA